MRVFIFDLDGTIIDSSERMHRLFCELVPKCNLTKEEYWDYKRNKINHKMLLALKYPDVDYEDFNRKWMPMIELEHYLILDKNFPDTIEVLDNLKKRTKIILLTARQSKKQLINELERLKIKDYFNEIFTTEGNLTKEELLTVISATNKEIDNKNNYFISDMGKDIELGNKMGYTTIGITHGFMSGEKLKEYNPDYLIEELSEILGLFI